MEKIYRGKNSFNPQNHILTFVINLPAAYCDNKDWSIPATMYGMARTTEEHLTGMMQYTVIKSINCLINQSQGEACSEVMWFGLE